MEAKTPAVDPDDTRDLRDAYFYGTGLLQSAEQGLLLQDYALEPAFWWVDSLKGSASGSRLDRLLPGLTQSLFTLTLRWRKLGEGQGAPVTEPEQRASERLRDAIASMRALPMDIGLPWDRRAKKWGPRESWDTPYDDLRARREAGLIASRREYGQE
jgi:hypothetical protein